jgi:hypothetical protein
LTQLISTPDLWICDYGVGLPGSQHNSTAFAATRIPQDRTRLLVPKEWMWADTAYPLQTWSQAPYKKCVLAHLLWFLLTKGCRPEKNEPNNTTYNYWVLRVCVRSEHTVGYWKGRFQSMRGLQVLIDRLEDIQFTLRRITATIVLHSFAVDHERGIPLDVDPFYIEGILFVKQESVRCAAHRDTGECAQTQVDCARACEAKLVVACARREELKGVLF